MPGDECCDKGYPVRLGCDFPDFLGWWRLTGGFKWEIYGGCPGGSQMLDKESGEVFKKKKLKSIHVPQNSPSLSVQCVFSLVIN